MWSGDHRFGGINDICLSQIGEPPESSFMRELKIRSQIRPLPRLEELEVIWRHLETRSNGSFFSSWGFIGPLLNLTQARPDLFIAHEGDEIAGLALIARTSRKSRLGRIDGLTLNQTGVEAEDLVYIEHNDVLCPDVSRPDILFALAKELATHKTGWKELHLAGFTNETAGALIAAVTGATGASGLTEAERKTSTAPWVDLERVRQDGYLPLLSGNTRRQITRSKRRFDERFGPVTLRSVKDEAGIRAGVATLAKLQTSRFDGTAAPSSFRSPFFVGFIEALLLSEPTGQTRADLLRIEAGDTLLGILVNLCHQAAVSNYQCAFTPFPDNNQLKPGLVSHALAIEHYANTGADIYHFLGGDQQYKKSLSTGADQMVWTRLQKPGPRLKLEALLKTAKARLAP